MFAGCSTAPPRSEPGPSDSDRGQATSADSGTVTTRQWPPVTEGNARFTVISPTLIRLEYAADGVFEDRPSQTVGTPPPHRTPYTTRLEGAERVVATEALTLRYRVDSGPFATDNLEITLHHDAEEVVARPRWGNREPNANQLGGWLRGLDLMHDAAPMNPGVLNRLGYDLLDDSETALLVAEPPGYAARPVGRGAYQDGYFFGYGRQYQTALADLRLLSGAAPLLPRKAFGVWFSRWYAYSGEELKSLVAIFRQEKIPLDTISLDTDWKARPDGSDCSLINLGAGAPFDSPCSWNGWSWNRSLFPDPAGFLSWAHAQGLSVTVNVHPSINAKDPALASFGAAGATLASDERCSNFLQGDPGGRCLAFDLSKPEQLGPYFKLHQPIESAGVDFFWLDWCCELETRVSVPGLTGDTWINEAYAREHRRMGSRWPAFSRMGSSTGPWGARPEAGEGLVGRGAFAEHRSTLHFTGDSLSTWELIRFAAEFTASEGAGVGIPYVSHDIGSFHGASSVVSITDGLPLVPHSPTLPDDMYVRWIQLGTFQPILRLHSQHGRRLPWEYAGDAAVIAADFLRLRERLVPYLYTLSRVAHDSGLPMVRALYLQWPELEQAYESRSNFTLGEGLFIATVATGGARPSIQFWLPPGRWYDFFTGAPVTGGTTIVRDVALSEYPVYARAGTIVPMQPDVPSSSAGPQDDLTLHVWAGADGTFALYEDAGVGFGYEQGQYQFTPVRFVDRPGCREVVIGAAEGLSFDGALPSRSWHVRIIGVPDPVRVRIGDHEAPRGLSGPGYAYDAAVRALTVHTGPQATRAELRVSVGADCK